MAPNPQDVTPAPRQLGRYEVIAPLGEGGMARLYLAVQRGPIANKLVVVKLLREQYTGDEQFIAMFADESRIAALLSHPNVIHTYESSATDSQYFIVMEFLEGKSFSQLLRRIGRQHFPLEVHLWVLCEMLAGLHYAHELTDFGGAHLNIVHRDVSPSNILITSRGEVKLLDFGIAKVQGAIAETQHGIVKGKLGYASPEQCVGRQTDARADIYSAGVMLWEALARKRRPMRESAILLHDETPHAQAAELGRDQALAGVEPRLVGIVNRALARDPADRFQTALEFERELRQCVSETAVPPAAALQKLVVEHFGGELAAIRRAIDERLGSGRPSAASELSALSYDTKARGSSDDPSSAERTATRPVARSGRKHQASVLVVLALAGAGFSWWSTRQTRHSADAGQVPAVHQAPPLVSAVSPAPAGAAPAPAPAPAPVGAAPAVEMAASEPLIPDPEPLSRAGNEPNAVSPRTPRRVLSRTPSRVAAPPARRAAAREVTALGGVATAQKTRAAEPGVDLGQNQGRANLPLRPLDERDPYAP